MDDASGRVGVVLMAYGSPRHLDEIEPYYTDIRRGRPPTPEALADLTARYAAIGGLSPLLEVTDAQARGLQAALDRLTPNRFEVALGFKHVEPKVATTARALADSGVDTVVGLVLAPHYSAYSVGQYLDAVGEGVAASDAAPDASPRIVPIESWAVEPAFVDLLAADLGERLTAMRGSGCDRVRVLFTAHSLPERILAAGDPYVEQLRSTAEAVAARLGLVEGDDWQIAWQSAGRTPEPWIGPDILTVIDELDPPTRFPAPGSQGTTGPGVDGLIVCACGFVADHLEVLYDLDIEAAGRAATKGLAFDRTACVNDDATVLAALAERVAAAVEA